MRCGIRLTDLLVILGVSGYLEKLSRYGRKVKVDTCIVSVWALRR
jgi:hypothetical protein